MKKHQSSTQKGFTLIELMIATTIFSIVLIVILASFLQIGRMYYKGVSITSTNEAARTLVDDIGNDIKLSQTTSAATPFAAGSPDYYFCLGNHRYSYNLSAADHKVTGNDVSSPNPDAPNGVVLSNVYNSCPNPSMPNDQYTDPQQLLGANMQLNNLTLTCQGFNGTAVQTCNIAARVVYYGADDSVLSPSATATNAMCNGSLLSTQFCAEADYTTNAITNF